MKTNLSDTPEPIPEDTLSVLFSIRLLYTYIYSNLFLTELSIYHLPVYKGLVLWTLKGFTVK